MKAEIHQSTADTALEDPYAFMRREFSQVISFSFKKKRIFSRASNFKPPPVEVSHHDNRLFSPPSLPYQKSNGERKQEVTIDVGMLCIQIYGHNNYHQTPLY